MMNNCALVLGGGGSRGFAHLGVMSYLETKNIRPIHIASSSAGALVAVCIAAGKTADETFDFFLKYNLLKTSFKFSFKELLNTRAIVSTILSFAGVTTFEELKIPVVMNAMDINTGAEKVFSSGSLQKALQASIALPIISVPVEIDGDFYVDGSMLDVVPVHLSTNEHPKIVVDISLTPNSIDRNSSRFAIVANLIILSQRRQLPDYELSNEDTFIRLPMHGFHLLEYSEKKHKEMFHLGKEEAKKVIFNSFS